MAKPICIIYFPDTFVVGNQDRMWIYEFMRFLNGEQLENDKWVSHKDFSDYHWFCFYKDEINAPEFQVFHEKDFTEIQYAELKKLITDSLASNENPKP